MSKWRLAGLRNAYLFGEEPGARILMDTITHALSGALLARATARVNDGISMNQRTWIGAMAAAFPDIDFVLLSIDSMTYLNWHRGPTHSLVLLPLWAFLLATLNYLVFRKQLPFLSLAIVCASCMGIHIAGDLITAYGTRIFFPISDLRATFSTTFIIDLLFTGILILGLVISRYWKPQISAITAMTILVLYVGMQSYWHSEAISLADTFARRNGFTNHELFALPQPLSPLNWKLVVVNNDIYYESYVRLHGTSGSFLTKGRLESIADIYRKPSDLDWTRAWRFGRSYYDKQLAQQAWERKEFEGFRKFAVLPVLLKVENHGARECAWFTDLRFVIGARVPPFRYGLCRQVNGRNWHLERLKTSLLQNLPSLKKRAG